MIYGSLTKYLMDYRLYNSIILANLVYLSPWYLHYEQTSTFYLLLSFLTTLMDIYLFSVNFRAINHNVVTNNIYAIKLRYIIIIILCTQDIKCTNGQVYYIMAVLFYIITTRHQYIKLCIRITTMKYADNIIPLWYYYHYHYIAYIGPCARYLHEYISYIIILFDYDYATHKCVKAAVI